ncbi:hypothetical protein NFI96_012259 [Prochilodus magdalenae]|nr:hypothetical protein NFI96_012259 [Prochilodus magdalenae]
MRGDEESLPRSHVRKNSRYSGFYARLRAGLKAVTAYALALLLLATFVSYACSAPKGTLQRRNWTPQAMLYLKGTQGRRFVSEDRNEGDVYDSLHLETRSQNTENLSVSKAATVLLNFLQQVKEEGEDNGFFFQDIPAWKRDYF